MRRITCCLIIVILTTACHLRADVTLPNIIAGHMVLQRDVSARLWGDASPGETISIWLNGKRIAGGAADATGKWCINLPAQGAATGATITIKGNNAITLDNIAFGDVWICSGQSNMVFQMFKADGGRADINAADLPNIRLFTVRHRADPVPQDGCDGRWQVCSPKVLGPFSAVAFYFGRKLHEDIDVPIGLITSAFGGTPAEAWTPHAALAADPAFAALLQRPVDYAAEYPQLLKQHESALAAWDESSGKRKPRAPLPPGKDPRMASVLYNAMIHPLTPMRIKGAIWYQGENNVSRAQQYRTLLPAMITAWRGVWDQGDFPFGIVQLASYLPRSDEPRDEPWARLRDAQAHVAQTVPNCGLALAIDVGDAKDIHPKDKRTVGLRLARWALAQVYGRDVEYAGPTFERMTIEDGAIRVTFTHADGLLTKDGQPPQGFAIAGDDRAFVWADATIDGASVILRSAQVAAPVAVRYGWLNNPPCNLYNNAGLPAAPFRTDDW